MLKINKIMTLGLFCVVSTQLAARYDNPFISGDEQRFKDLIEPNRPVDQIVKQAIQRSGTWWLNSSSWKNKISAFGAREHTWFSGDLGHGYQGTAEFTINNNLGRISVDSKMETNAVVTGTHALQAVLGGGTQVVMREAELLSKQNVGNTRCEHRLIIKRKGPTNFERIVEDVYNYPNCTNHNCTNRECVRLRRQREDRDTAAFIASIVVGQTADRYELTWLDTCHSDYDSVDDLFSGRN